MDTEIAPRTASALDVERASDAELRQELAAQLTLTARSLARAAEIWTELQRRGIDLRELRSGLAVYLPRIARGELAAEAVVAFAGQKMLLQHLTGMPLDEQRRYAGGDPITIAAQDDQGQIIGEQRRLVELSGREVLLAISNGSVRPLKAQSDTLRRQSAKPTRRRHATGSTARVRADTAAGTVVVGRVRLEPLDLSAALKALGFDLVRRSGGQE